MIYKLTLMSSNLELEVGSNHEGIQAILSRLGLVNAKDEEATEDNSQRIISDVWVLWRCTTKGDDHSLWEGKDGVQGDSNRDIWV